MTQLISNVLMQPKPDAVEPLTLIEKLEGYHQSLYERWYDNHKHPYDEGAMDAVEKAVNIVKKHQGEDGSDPYETGFYDGVGDRCRHHGCNWIPVSARLPEDNQEVLAILELTGFYMLAFVRNGIWYNADDGEQIARHKDRRAVTYWMPTPQPPSEVQDD